MAKPNPPILNVKQGLDGVLQSSPHVVLTFFRFQNRSKNRLTNNTASGTDMLNPLVVTNDCLSCSVSEKKEGYTSSFSATLKGSDFNYLTAVHAGDYVIANFVNGAAEANRIRDSINRGEPINRYEHKISGKDTVYQNDGFKGLFKIQSVRRSVTIENGVKRTQYRIVGYSHYFLTNKVYFIPQLVYPGEKKNRWLFYEMFTKKAQDYIATKGDTNIQSTLKTFMDSFLGAGFSGNDKSDRSPNATYFVPKDISKALGVTGERAIDLTNVVIGPQEYNSSSASAPAFKRSSPSLKKVGDGRLFEANGKKLWGTDFSTPQQFNMTSIGDIFKQYLNEPLNEMYVCHRMDPTEGKVLPTITIREKPFTSLKGEGRTKFSSIPVWDLDNSLYIKSLDTGIEEAARVNFVQVYGRTQAANFKSNYGAQVAAVNWRVDNEDIQAHGLRPYVVNSNFDFPEGETSGGKTAISMSPFWAGVIADWVFGNHLKLNGTALCKGIFDPIVPGDNTKIDGITYHIESVSHSFQMAGDRRTFNTQLSLSYGMDLDSGNGDEALSYPEMRDQSPNYHQKNRITEDEDKRVGGTKNGEEYTTSTGRGQANDVVRTNSVPTPPYLNGKKES